MINEFSTEVETLYEYCQHVFVNSHFVVYCYIMTEVCAISVGLVVKSDKMKPGPIKPLISPVRYHRMSERTSWELEINVFIALPQPQAHQVSQCLVLL